MVAKRHAFLGALLGAVSGALLLTLLEGALRLLGFGGDPAGFYYARFGERVLEPGMFAPHPERFFTLRAEYRHSPEHAGPNALGPWPFRGRPLEPAPSAPWRILVFGDSCVFGLPLPANQSLPTLLDQRLSERLGPEAVLVANLGVPGYSTVQIRALVEEALERWAPDEVVLYPAAWNDQVHSFGRNDVELAAYVRSRTFLHRTALADAVRELRRTPPPEESADTRVPEEFVEGEVRATIRACRARGVGVTVVVPPHPESRRASHARMFRDADAVRRAGAAEDVAVVDLQAMLGRPELEDRYFTDIVHPAPEAQGLLAVALADRLEPRAPSALAPGGGTLAIQGFEPRVVPALGDLRLRVRVEGLHPGVPIPAIVVGGTALLDVVREADGALSGTVPRLAPGEVEIGVQAESAVAFADFPLIVLGPRLEEVPPEDGQGPRVRVSSRPGDVARVVAARRLRKEPQHSARGAFALERTALLPCDLVFVLGPDGSAEADLPPLPRGDGGGPIHLQALVAPPGEDVLSDFALWSAPATLR